MDMRPESDVVRPFARLDRVRCLDCGLAYAKPAGGGTVRDNPGCPSCGYLGWIPAGVDAYDVTSEGAPSARSVVDLRPHRAVPRH